MSQEVLICSVCETYLGDIVFGNPCVNVSPCQTTVQIVIAMLCFLSRLLPACFLMALFSGFSGLGLLHTAQAQEEWLASQFKSRHVNARPATPGWKVRGMNPARAGDIAALLRRKGVRRGAPVFIRIFKQESLLELWMKKGPRFTLVKSYPICKWSGKLGPKLRVGDRQAPEGFYRVSARQMNPHSKYHLSFNLGYPNRLERSYGRTGSALMVHGKCVSAGCYAMTDPLIEEIYAVMSQAFQAGQRIIDVHAFPFRMTAANIDKYGHHRWAAFWWNLKQGYDVFEATLNPPKTEACRKKYVFTPPPLNAEGIENPSWACMMNARGPQAELPVRTANYQ